MDKMKLMGVLKENPQKELYTENLRYVMDIIRIFLQHDPQIQASLQLQKNHDFRFFEIY